MKLLIIRPEPGASASAVRAKAAGFAPVLLPFFEIRPVSWHVPDPTDFDGLLLTSANAVRQAGKGLELLRSLRVHCVGDQTAAAAQAAGLMLATVGATDVENALQAAAAAGDRRLFWLAGLDHIELPVIDHMQIVRAICYKSRARKLPGDARSIIASCEAVALHSRRAAKQFSGALASLGLSKAQFYAAAFSPAIAREAGEGWRGVAVAAQPLDNALLSALATLGRQDRTASSRKEEI